MEKMINMAKKFVRKTFFWGAVSDVYIRRSLSRLICPLFHVFYASFGFREKYFSRLRYIHIFLTFYPSAIFSFFLFHLFHLWLAKWHAYEGRKSNFFCICCFILFFRRLFSGATRFKILIIFYYYNCTAVIFAQRIFFFFQTKSFLEISVQVTPVFETWNSH